MINPRPSSKNFASLAERETAHAKLFAEAMVANSAGELQVACDKFSEAYSLLFRTGTLLSLISVRLKLGDSDLACACYSKLLQSPGMLSAPADQLRVQTKLMEARQLHADVRAIMEAPQSALLNTPDERERAHRKLVEKAKAANDKGNREEAQRFFLEAWPLLFRVSTLVSAANMMAHLGGRQLRLAIGVYGALLRLDSPRLANTELTEEEIAMIERKIAESRIAVGEASREEAAARFLQSRIRGKFGRAVARSRQQIASQAAGGRRGSLIGRRASLATGGARRGSVRPVGRASVMTGASTDSAGGGMAGATGAPPAYSYAECSVEEHSAYGVCGDGSTASLDSVPGRLPSGGGGARGSVFAARGAPMQPFLNIDEESEASLVEYSPVVSSPKQRVQSAGRKGNRRGSDDVAMKIAQYGHSAAGGRGLAILAEYQKDPSLASPPPPDSADKSMHLFGVKLPFSWGHHRAGVEPTNLAAGAMVDDSADHSTPTKPSPAHNQRGSIFAGGGR